MRSDFYGLPATQGNELRAASLPYADDNLSLVVVVPDAGQFSQVESSLDANTLGTLVAGLTNQVVSVALPRFKVRDRNESKGPSQGPGMTSAFIPGIADFSGMDGTQNLFIWKVMHKAFINVAERAPRPQPPRLWS